MSNEEVDKIKKLELDFKLVREASICKIDAIQQLEKKFEDLDEGYGKHTHHGSILENREKIEYLEQWKKNFELKHDLYIGKVEVLEKSVNTGIWKSKVTAKDIADFIDKIEKQWNKIEQKVLGFMENLNRKQEEISELKEKIEEIQGNSVLRRGEINMLSEHIKDIFIQIWKLEGEKLVKNKSAVVSTPQKGSKVSPITDSKPSEPHRGTKDLSMKELKDELDEMPSAHTEKLVDKVREAKYLHNKAITESLMKPSESCTHNWVAYKTESWKCELCGEVELTHHDEYEQKPSEPRHKGHDYINTPLAKAEALEPHLEYECIHKYNTQYPYWECGKCGHHHFYKSENRAEAIRMVEQLPFGDETRINSHIADIAHRETDSKPKGGCYQITYCNECMAFPMGLGCPKEEGRIYVKETLKKIGKI